MTLAEEARERFAGAVWDELTRYARKQGWTIDGVRVTPSRVGAVLDWGERSYLRYQDQGTRPYLMRHLEGRVVPLPGGPRLVVRVGEPGWVTYSPMPGVEVTRWRDRRWEHPGLPKLGFVEQAARNAREQVMPAAMEARRAETLKLALTTWAGVAQHHTSRSSEA